MPYTLPFDEFSWADLRADLRDAWEDICFEEFGDECDYEECRINGYTVEDMVSVAEEYEYYLEKHNKETDPLSPRDYLLKYIY